MKDLFKFILAIIILAGVFLQNGCTDNTIQELVIDKNISDNEVFEQSEPIIDNKESEQIKSEIQLALQSGGIRPEAYDEMEKRIENLEIKGYKTEELWTMLSKLSVGGQEQARESNNSTRIEAPAEDDVAQSGIVIWQYMDGIWKPTGNPPACPEPLILESPVDLDLATSILYPGQFRGDFKPHGGIKTDDADGPVEVRAPLEGYIVDVAKFYDAAGIHYMFDIQHSCGIMNRIGHLGAVPPKLEAVFDNVPTGGFGDSRTYEVEPFFIEQGEVLATDTQGSTGFDWGVYDLRKENEASQNSAFREAHKDESYQAYYALCWLDYLSEEEQKIVKSLPGADGKEGKNSDYC